MAGELGLSIKEATYTDGTLHHTRHGMNEVNRDNARKYCLPKGGGSRAANISILDQNTTCYLTTLWVSF